MNKVKPFLLFFILTITCFSCDRPEHIYYIDALSGSDDNSGLSSQKAWLTIARASKGNYQAGDQILLRGGQNHMGSLILDSISGKPGLPVIISSFGANRAIILSGDSTAIQASYCAYLEVKNLVCKGSGRLMGNHANGLDFILNTNLTVDSVETSGYFFSGVQVSEGSNIRITNTYAYDNGFSGIHVISEPSGSDNSQETSIRNVYIGYSVAENNPGCPAIKDNHSGNGILIGGVSNAIIEYCEAMNNGWDMPREGNGPVGIWAYMSDSVVIQHCYAHHNKTSAKGADGGGFDFDGGITNSIMQYNLSAFNEGAGYGMFQYAEAQTWDNNIVRYNISYDDGIKNGQSGVFMWCDPSAIPMKNLYAYNNTVVNNYGYGVNFLPGQYDNFVFENNIFLVTDSTDEFTGGEFTGALFDQNLYWNTFHSQIGVAQPKVRVDTNPLVADPILLIPSDGSLGSLNPQTINSISFFKIQDGSSARMAGKKISNNGGKDYWGKPVSADQKPNLGAFGE